MPMQKQRPIPRKKLWRRKKALSQTSGRSSTREGTDVRGKTKVAAPSSPCPCQLTSRTASRHHPIKIQIPSCKRARRKIRPAMVRAATAYPSRARPTTCEHASLTPAKPTTARVSSSMGWYKRVDAATLTTETTAI